MPEPKSRKSVDGHIKLAAVRRLQTGGMSAQELAKELDVSIWSLRKWSRKYRNKARARAGVVAEPVAPAIQAEESPAKPRPEPLVTPPVVDSGLIAAIARIESEISSLDKQREALKSAVEILRQRSGTTPQ